MGAVGLWAFGFGLWALGVGVPAAAQGLSREEALAAVYGGANIRAEQLFLTPAQVEQVAARAGPTRRRLSSPGISPPRAGRSSAAPTWTRTPSGPRGKACSSHSTHKAA